MASEGERGRGAWRDRRAWIAGGIALLAVVAVPALVLALGSSKTPSSSSGGGNGTHGGTTSTSASTTTSSALATTTSTTSNVLPVVPPTTAPPAPPAPPPIVTGKVTRAGGAPVAHAYVVGLDDLAVAMTNTKGVYSMRCTGQALVASPWLMPVTSPDGSTVAGASGRVSKSLGQGYVFSGGTADIGKAAPAPCGAKPYDLRLPLGATVAINLTDSSGRKFVPAPGQAPVDSFSLPGFGDRAGAVVAPVSSAGVQIVPQLGAGVLTIHVTQGAFTCHGAGVTPPTASTTVQVTTTPGKLVFVKCQMTATPAP